MVYGLDDGDEYLNKQQYPWVWTCRHVNISYEARINMMLNMSKILLQENFSGIKSQLLQNKASKFNDDEDELSFLK